MVFDYPGITEDCPTADLKTAPGYIIHKTGERPPTATEGCRWDTAAAKRDPATPDLIIKGWNIYPRSMLARAGLPKWIRKRRHHNSCHFGASTLYIHVYIVQHPIHYHTTKYCILGQLRWRVHNLCNETGLLVFQLQHTQATKKYLLC